MAKVSLTKGELKNQRDALKRFTRYLPTLQLKKQQLQLEVRRARERLAEARSEADAMRADAEQWAGLIHAEAAEHLRSLVSVRECRIGWRNIAGIEVPYLEDVALETAEYDPFANPLWYPEAIELIRDMLEKELRRLLLEEQVRRIETELRSTTQRVNLFEKVKIPETRENIRIIQIYLGDQQANAVARAKIAKGKAQARETANA